MCGRYSLTIKKKQLVERFEAGDGDHVPRFNIAPGQEAPVVVRGEARRLAAMSWGLLPAWTRDPAAARRPVNARIESVTSRPTFRHLVDRRRCLVPADGFYEWRAGPRGGRKTPFRIARRDRAPFALAGLWDRWEPPGLPPRCSFTILTTVPNALIRTLHDRMPVILRPPDEAAWLDGAIPFTALAARCAEPFPGAELEAWEVSTYVNAPAHEGPRCAEPARPDPDLFGAPGAGS